MNEDDAKIVRKARGIWNEADGVTRSEFIKRSKAFSKETTKMMDLTICGWDSLSFFKEETIKKLAMEVVKFKGA